jgi:hypothetical protein
MRTYEVYGIAFPFLLAAILFGGAFISSRLMPTTKTQIVKLFFAPLFVVGELAYLVHTIIERKWGSLWIAPLIFAAFFHVFRLYRPLQTPDSGKPT